MWSDMYFGLAFNNYYEAEKEFDRTVIEKIPHEITLTYWDYFHEKSSDYDKMLKRHRLLQRKVRFAGGIWTWVGFAPQNDYPE